MRRIQGARAQTPHFPPWHRFAASYLDKEGELVARNAPRSLAMPVMAHLSDSIPKPGECGSPPPVGLPSEGMVLIELASVCSQLRCSLLPSSLRRTGRTSRIVPRRPVMYKCRQSGALALCFTNCDFISADSTLLSEFYERILTTPRSSCQPRSLTQ